MFTDLQPYTSTRDTALPWAKSVPRHWKIQRAKTIMYAVDIRSTTGKEELLTVSSSRGVVPRSSANVTMFQAASYVGHKLCWPDDLVINSLWAWGRGLGVATNHGIVSTAYGVYRQRHRALEPAYLHQLVRSQPFQWALQVRSQGVWKSRLQMTDERWLDAPLLIPPAAEQAAIVKYLAHANARVDKAITAKRRLITLLEEQSIVIARHTLAGRGQLDAELDSGERVPWLGPIPKLWDARPLKRVARLRSGAGFPSDRQGRTGNELPFFRVSDMGTEGNEMFLEKCDSTVSREEAAELGAVVFDGGVVCFPKVGGALLTNKRRMLKQPSCLDNNLMGAEFTGLNPDYGFEVMKLVDLSDVAKPGPVPAVGQGDVGRIRFPVPPPEIQRALQRDLSFALAELLEGVSSASREIALLQEFRTRLVADVVTGQVDVRGVSATLPDAVEVGAGAGDEGSPVLDEELVDVVEGADV